MGGKTTRTPEDKPISSRDVGKRWTPAQVKNGWTPAADDFLGYYGLVYPQISNGEAMFIVQLMSYMRTEKKPFPAIKTVAKRMGISSTQARSYARSLEGKSCLKRVMRVETTNGFDLTSLFRAIEAESKRHPKTRSADEDDDE